MGIVDPKGKTPEPEGGPTVKEDQRDPIREIEEGYYRGEKLKAFKQGAGIGNDTQVQASEKTSVDVAAMFAATTDLLKTSMNKVEELRNANQTAKTDPYLQHLETELQEMRTRLNAPGQDPAEALIQNMTRLQAFTQIMKEHLGISPGAQVAPSDVPRLIEMERLKQDGEERKRQWDMQMATQQRQWEREDRRWMEEFKLKRMEFAENRQTRGHAVRALEDLAGSVVDSIDAERGGTGSPGPGRKPKTWKCDCGAIVRTSSPEDTEAICESCGAYWDLALKEADEAKTAGA